MATDRLTAEAIAKVRLEARMALRAHYQTFDPFDVPKVEDNPTPAISHVHTRRQILDAMKGATYR